MTKNNLYSYIQLSRKKSSQKLLVMPSSINQCTRPTWKKQARFQFVARGPCTETALERCFPSLEERVRPPFPARSEPGLISAAPCQFPLAVYPARCLEVAPGAHGTRSSHCPPETQGVFGDTASKTPLLSWHN